MYIFPERSYLYDREHTIGHAFFTGLTGENATLEKLGYIFETAIFPLLQEYFYEDYEKIQLVLGDNAKSRPELKFIRDDTVCAGNIFKGNARPSHPPPKSHGERQAAHQIPPVPDTYIFYPPCNRDYRLFYQILLGEQGSEKTKKVFLKMLSSMKDFKGREFLDASLKAVLIKLIACDIKALPVR